MNLSTSPQVFTKDEHTIIWGDAVESLQLFVKDESIDLIFVDPPYNIGKDFNGNKDKWKSSESYLTWCFSWLNICLQKLKKNGSLYIMTATQNMPYIDIYLRERTNILSRIVWFYDSSGVQAKKHFGSLYEPILFCVKDKSNYTFNAENILVEAKTGARRKLIDYRKQIPTVYNTKKIPGNVWEIPRVRYRMDEYEEHPTQKPIALLERIVLASSNPGDTILDPFSGTFTTSYVAKIHGRKSIGIEIEEEYIKIGLRRLEISSEYKGKKLERTARTFEQKNVNNLRLFE